MVTDRAEHRPLARGRGDKSMGVGADDQVRSTGHAGCLDACTWIERWDAGSTARISRAIACGRCDSGHRKTVLDGLPKHLAGQPLLTHDEQAHQPPSPR